MLQRHRQILLLESDPKMGRILSTCLHEAGFLVAHLTRYDELLKHPALRQSNIIVFDPDQTGLPDEALPIELQRREITTPWMVLCNKCDVRRSVRLMQAGAADLLMKETGFLDLLPHSIHRILDRLDAAQLLASADSVQRRNQRNNQELLDAMPMLAALVDNAGKCITSNLAAQRQGIRPGLHCSTIFNCLPEDCEWCPVKHSARSGSRCTREIEIGGVPYEISWSPLDSGHLLLLAQDLTARHDEDRRRRQLERQFQQAQKMESMGQLAGAIAHDFNNQLMSISGYVGNALKQFGDEPVAEHLQRIAATSEAASELVRKLLGFSRTDRSSFQSVNLHRILRDTMDLLKHSCRHIDVHLEEQAANCVLLGDPGELQNALINLGFNARDAMPEGGRLLFRTETVRLNHASNERPADSSSWIRLSVCDTGTGMEEEVLSHIFEPFFTTKGRGKGTGLGLASVYSCVRNHQGTVEVDSRKGFGTEFRILLPLCESGVRPGSLHPNEPQALILLVDDDVVVRGVARNILRDLGFAVRAFPGGPEALEWFAEAGDRVDLALLDMRMPQMNGWELLQELRRIRPDLPTLFFTAYADLLDPSQLAREGVKGVIRKPFNLEELFTRVTAALGRDTRATVSEQLR